MNDALRKLYASNPIDQVRLLTLELRNPDFVGEGGEPSSFYLVKDRFKPYMAVLEDGVEVTFRPWAFELTLPRLGDQKPRLQLKIDGASAEVYQQLLRASQGSRKPIYAVVREYIEGDPTGPQNDPPLVMRVKDPVVNGLTVTCSAEFADVVNRSYPSTLYTLETHPAL